MIRIIRQWFKCCNCNAKGDTGYEIECKGKKIVVCVECLRKIKKRKKYRIASKVWYQNNKEKKKRRNQIDRWKAKLHKQLKELDK